MRTTHFLESKSYVPGGNVQVSFRDAPPGKRIVAVLVRFEALFTQSAAPAEVKGQDLSAIFANVELGKRIKGTGKYFDFLNWIMRGAQMSLPASIPATASTAFRRTLSLVIPFADQNAASPADGAALTEYFRDTPLILDFAGPTLFPTLTISGTIRTTLILEDAEVGVVPSAIQLGYTDWTGKSMFLEPGLYTHGFFYKEAIGGSTITSDEIKSLSVTVDGSRVNDLIRPHELAIISDYFYAEGSALRSDSATAPVAGENLTDEPSVAGGASDLVTMEYVPTIVPPPKYNMTTGAILVEKTCRIDFDGTLQSFRMGWRRVEARSAEQAVKAMVKAGVVAPDPGMIRAKTVSKKELSPIKARFLRFLPLRHEA